METFEISLMQFSEWKIVMLKHSVIVRKIAVFKFQKNL